MHLNLNNLKAEALCKLDVGSLGVAKSRANHTGSWKYKMRFNWLIIKPFINGTIKVARDNSTATMFQSDTHLYQMRCEKLIILKEEIN